jgi:rRNA pseudouridine-1189 N-methylase Emg1 (Nep1/Mra1 family)
LKVLKKNLASLLSEFKGDFKEPLVFLAKEGGIQTSLSELESMLPSSPFTPVIIGIGAFPHGDFSEEITHFFQSSLEFDKEILMAWHVCAEVLWTYSRKMEVIEKRYRTSEVPS